ncbi:MAG: retroviral-like aspartic protease family protein [Nitrospira sp.]|nr:retroviral-like aspartic protease family protein [Nitrospira sp.]MCB9711182.1 retroviral-like aspartic protease family protein [Nitrospiraceae bacterium]MDR4486814.1 retroviral-like aspartic protease family protein [Nitrospirales bacterium]MCA9464784.1 retroviral-like aspartic protease family protein [Nitrospira sp.]MCA9481369.1 retroviral-like aspartic protease family protein [Nitrospira sp.]
MSRSIAIFALGIIAFGVCTQVLLKDFPIDKAVQFAKQDLRPSSEITADSEETVVPLERLGGVWVARVEFNDLHSAQLIVDTGATFTTISEDLAFDAGIGHAPGKSGIQLFTAGGNVQAEMALAKKIRVGNAGRKNVQVVIHTIPNLPEGIDGLLGLSFFDRFLVHLDQSAQQLHLTPKR